ncbi:MAG: formylglycine-generating enzyme family protein [Acidobacteria bacterium]|nr:formylglycine-generating enzyme family protein [Acidobacteriota bacterium]MDA1234956.1 formylglycine-generating enzyme family protein [Acidobacteriota bacterium]
MSLPAHKKACCAPTMEHAAHLEESRAASRTRRRTTIGETAGMLRLDGGKFLMGTDHDKGFPADGEGPVRQIRIDPFWIDAHPVTTEEFARFVKATGYQTDSERFGWSFVFQGHLAGERYKQLVEDTVLAAQWWCKVPGSDWAHPEGPDSSIEGLENYPVTHVSWDDAAAYADWAGKRIATEAEFEYAQRGGTEQQLFWWGDDLEPDGKHLCNVFQGRFPDQDTAADGYSGVAPVDAFPANPYGMLSSIGNVWEWTADWFSADYHVDANPFNPVGPTSGTRRVMKGGSYLCHESYCNRYRLGARTGNTPDSAAGNIGFRCVRDI